MEGAQACINADRPEEAVRRAERALTVKLTPNLRMEAHSRLATACLRTGDLEAERHKRLAIAVAEEFGRQDRAASYYAGLGAIVLERGRTAEAIRFCEKAIAVSPKPLSVAHLNLAACFRTTGRYAKCREALEEMSRAQAPTRIALHCGPQRIATGEHRKVAGTY